MKQRLLNFLIALDQLAYVIVTLGYGMPDETMSGAAWRLEQRGKLGGRIFRPIIDWIFSNLFSDPDHCQTSHDWEMRRAEMKWKRYD